MSAAALTSTPEPGSAHWLLAISAAAGLHAGVLFWQVDPNTTSQETALPPSGPMLLPAAELPRREDVATTQPIVPDVVSAELAEPIAAAEPAEAAVDAIEIASAVQAATAVEPATTVETPLAVAAEAVTATIDAQPFPAEIAPSQLASPVAAAVQPNAQPAPLDTVPSQSLETVNAKPVTGIEISAITSDPSAVQATPVVQPTAAFTASLPSLTSATSPRVQATPTVVADDVPAPVASPAPARIVSSADLSAIAQPSSLARQATPAAAVTTSGSVPQPGATTVASQPTPVAAAAAPTVALSSPTITTASSAPTASVPVSTAAPVASSTTATAALPKPAVVAALPQEPAQAAASIEEAPTVDETLSAAIDAFLAQEECARIDREPGGTRVAALVTSDESRERLQTQLATESVGAPVELQIDVVQPSFCPALLTLPIAVEGGEQMALNNEDGLYLDGELLALSIGPVPVGGHLYVVFVDHDGSVQYLVPSEFEKGTEIAIGATRELGAEQDILDVLEALGISIGNWRASPPYGRGLIMAFVTDSELDPAPSDIETGSTDYFVALGDSLAGNPALWARFRWIDTRPRG